MHIDPIKDAARHFDAIDSATDRLIRAELHAMSVFNGAIRTGDANAIVTFAPMLPDWHKAGRPYHYGPGTPKRFQTVTELFAESLDFEDGPTTTELYQLLINAAAGVDCKDSAQQLLARMKASWAKYNAEYYLEDEDDDRDC